MPGLTSKEASRIEEGLHLSDTVARKVAFLSSQVTDPECRRILNEVQNLQQRHFDILRRHVESTASLGGFSSNLGTGVGTGAGFGGYQASSALQGPATFQGPSTYQGSSMI